MIRRVPWSVWCLRAVAALGAAVALWAGAPEGLVPSLFVVLVTAGLGLAYAFLPEHFIGPIVLVVVLLWWSLHVGGAMPGGVAAQQGTGGGARETAAAPARGVWGDLPSDGRVSGHDPPPRSTAA